MYEAGLDFLASPLCHAHSPPFSSPFSAVHKVAFYPVADLSVFERCDSYCYIKFLRRPLSLHPLMPRKHTYHLPLPAPASPIPHPSVDSWPAGTGLSVTVLVQQVWCLLTGLTEPIHQFAWTVIVKSWEMDSMTRQPLSRRADTQLHVAAFVGFLEFKQSIVIVHPNVIGIPFNPSFGNMGALGSDPLELHFVIGWRGVRSGATFNIIGEVGRKEKGRRLCFSLLGF